MTQAGRINRRYNCGETELMDMRTAREARWAIFEADYRSARGIGPRFSQWLDAFDAWWNGVAA